MVIDSSALVAIVYGEPGARQFATMIGTARRPCISAPTLVEASMVIGAKRGSDGLEVLDDLIARTSISVIPFDAHHAALARAAFRKFGKGRHPAALNFGDCCAYALARSLGEPLLHKGTDFARTDVTAAV